MLLNLNEKNLILNENITQIKLNFNIEDTLFEKINENLIITINGEEIILENFYSIFNNENIPSFILENGEEILGEEFFAAFDETLMPAAGPANTEVAEDGGRFSEFSSAVLAEGVNALGGTEGGSEYARAGYLETTLPSGTLPLAGITTPDTGGANPPLSDTEIPSNPPSSELPSTPTPEEKPEEKPEGDLFVVNNTLASSGLAKEALKIDVTLEESCDAYLRSLSGSNAQGFVNQYTNNLYKQFSIGGEVFATKAAFIAFIDVNVVASNDFDKPSVHYQIYQFSNPEVQAFLEETKSFAGNVSQGKPGDVFYINSPHFIMTSDFIIPKGVTVICNGNFTFYNNGGSFVNNGIFYVNGNIETHETATLYNNGVLFVEESINQHIYVDSKENPNPEDFKITFGSDSYAPITLDFDKLVNDYDESYTFVCKLKNENSGTLVQGENDFTVSFPDTAKVGDKIIVEYEVTKDGVTQVGQLEYIASAEGKLEISGTTVFEYFYNEADNAFIIPDGDYLIHDDECNDTIWIEGNTVDDIIFGDEYNDIIWIERNTVEDSFSDRADVFTLSSGDLDKGTDIILDFDKSLDFLDLTAINITDNNYNLSVNINDGSSVISINNVDGALLQNIVLSDVTLSQDELNNAINDEYSFIKI